MSKVGNTLSTAFRVLYTLILKLSIKCHDSVAFASNGDSSLSANSLGVRGRLRQLPKYTASLASYGAWRL